MEGSILPTIEEHFGDITDPRIDRTKLHDLMNILDLAFDEDRCRVRKDHGAENLALLRHIALNLLKQEKTCKRGIQGKRLLAGWNPDYLLKVLAGFARLGN